MSEIDERAMRRDRLAGPKPPRIWVRLSGSSHPRSAAGHAFPLTGPVEEQGSRRWPSSSGGSGLMSLRDARRDGEGSRGRRAYPVPTASRLVIIRVNRRSEKAGRSEKRMAGEEGSMRLRKRMLASGIVITVVTLAALGGMTLAAQDKYTVQVPGGLAFSEFRGYEDWPVVAVSQPEGKLNVIVANTAMIDAYLAGVPDNGKPFPDGSKMAKIAWKPKQSEEAPFAVNVRTP